MPEHLGFRLLMAVLVAIAVLVLLQVALTRKPVEAASPAAAALPEPGAELRSPQLVESLAGPGAWLVYLAGEGQRLPDGIAPVIRVAADGRLRLERPAPLAETPTEEWLAAGVVLPVRSLSELDPGQRVALLDAMAVAAGNRTLHPDQVIPWGLDAPVAERARLLRWLRRP